MRTGRNCDGESLETYDAQSKGLLLARRQHKREAMPTRKIGRDAKTGEFIKVKEAKRRPATTVVETIKTRKPRKK